MKKLFSIIFLLGAFALVSSGFDQPDIEKAQGFDIVFDQVAHFDAPVFDNTSITSPNQEIGYALHQPIFGLESYGVQPLRHKYAHSSGTTNKVISKSRGPPLRWENYHSTRFNA